MDAHKDKRVRNVSDGGPQDSEDPDHGVELDKIEIPKTAEKSDEAEFSETAPQVESNTEPETEPNTEPEIKPELEPAIKRLPSKKNIVFMALAAILILGLASFFALQMLMSPAIEIEKPYSGSGAYQDIEPIVTNLGKNSYVDIALMIRFDPEEKAQFTILKSKIKDTILTFLASPDFQKEIAVGRPEKNETYVYDKLTRLLTESYPNQVMITALRIY
jgi:hypothetical protein